MDESKTGKSFSGIVGFIAAWKKKIDGNLALKRLDNVFPAVTQETAMSGDFAARR
jgi:hypothetical protein